MTRIGGPDEFVAFNAEQTPKFLILRIYSIRQFLRRNSLLLGRPFDVLSVLVGSRQQLDIETHHALVPGNRVGDKSGIRTAQMRRRIDVVERCGDVKGRRHKQLVYLTRPHFAHAGGVPGN